MKIDLRFQGYGHVHETGEAAFGFNLILDDEGLAHLLALIPKTEHTRQLLTVLRQAPESVATLETKIAAHHAAERDTWS